MARGGEGGPRRRGRLARSGRGTGAMPPRYARRLPSGNGAGMAATETPRSSESRSGLEAMPRTYDTWKGHLSGEFQADESPKSVQSRLISRMVSGMWRVCGSQCVAPRTHCQLRTGTLGHRDSDGTYAFRVARPSPSATRDVVEPSLSPQSRKRYPREGCYERTYPRHEVSAARSRAKQERSALGVHASLSGIRGETEQRGQSGHPPQNRVLTQE